MESESDSDDSLSRQAATASAQLRALQQHVLESVTVTVSQAHSTSNTDVKSDPGPGPGPGPGPFDFTSSVSDSATGTHTQPEAVFNNSESVDCHSATVSVRNDQSGKQQSRLSRVRACGPCNVGKIRCAAERPCPSCIKRGREHLCLMPIHQYKGIIASQRKLAQSWTMHPTQHHNMLESPHSSSSVPSDSAFHFLQPLPDHSNVLIPMQLAHVSQSDVKASEPPIPGSAVAATNTLSRLSHTMPSAYSHNPQVLLQPQTIHDYQVAYNASAGQHANRTPGMLQLLQLVRGPGVASPSVSGPGLRLGPGPGVVSVLANSQQQPSPSHMNSLQNAYASHSNVSHRTVSRLVAPAAYNLHTSRSSESKASTEESDATLEIPSLVFPIGLSLGYHHMNSVDCCIISMPFSFNSATAEAPRTQYGWVNAAMVRQCRMQSILELPSPQVLSAHGEFLPSADPGKLKSMKQFLPQVMALSYFAPSCIWLTTLYCLHRMTTQRATTFTFPHVFQGKDNSLCACTTSVRLSYDPNGTARWLQCFMKVLPHQPDPTDMPTWIKNVNSRLVRAFWDSDDR
jgi:hypothetical protein